MKSNIKVVGLLVISSILVAVVLSACGSTNPSNESKIPAPQEVAVNAPIQVGDAIWTVTGVERAPAFGEGSSPPNGMYIAVHVTLQNVSKETQTAPDLTVIDSQGNKTTSATGKYVAAPESWGQELLMQGMGGGATINGYYLFDVLPTATGLKLQVKGWSLTETQEGSVNLGI
jgi:hypothetical protein